MINLEKSKRSNDVKCKDKKILSKILFENVL